MVDEAEILLHAEAVGYMFVELFAGIEFILKFRNSKALRHDFDHAEGVPPGGFAQGEARMCAGIDDYPFGAFVGQNGSQHPPLETSAKDSYIVLVVHLK